MKMHEMFPSNWLKGEEIRDKYPKGIKLVMAEGKLEEMPDGGYKPVLYFERTKKGLVLNKTNGDTIAEHYGDDSDAWIGKSIVLYFDKNVTFAGKKTGGIRVRIPEDGRTRKQEPEPEPPPPDDADAPGDEDSSEIPF